VTARHEAESALQEADRRKDEFLATLAHELRNPLTPIRNAVHILKKKYGPQFPDAPLFAMVQRQVDHLVRLVDDLLEVSRISSGKVDLRQENVSVSDFLRHALESCQPLIENKRHRVTVKVADEPLQVFGDSVRLAQIAANIINNAAKYTPPGGRIEIDAARGDDEVVLRVRDNGVGISADMMPRVFDLFAQTDDQIRLSEGGLGIGLALVRSLVEIHGGRVEARSAGVGRGSEFIVSLPLADRAYPAASRSSGG
jgi:signal transduction histidine kinase